MQTFCDSQSAYKEEQSEEDELHAINSLIPTFYNSPSAYKEEQSEEDMQNKINRYKFLRIRLSLLKYNIVTNIRNKTHLSQPLKR